MWLLLELRLKWQIIMHLRNCSLFTEEFRHIKIKKLEILWDEEMPK